MGKVLQLEKRGRSRRDHGGFQGGAIGGERLEQGQVGGLVAEPEIEQHRRQGRPGLSPVLRFENPAVERPCKILPACREHLRDHAGLVLEFTAEPRQPAPGRFHALELGVVEHQVELFRQGGMARLPRLGQDRRAADHRLGVEIAQAAELQLERQLRGSRLEPVLNA